MKITLGQIRIFTNNPEKNYNQILNVIESNTESDLIVFPQLALSGMYVGDALLKKEVQDEYLRFNVLIQEIKSDAVIVFGNIHREEDVLYNAAFVSYKGEWLCDPIIKQNLSPYETNYFGTKESDDGFEMNEEDILISFNEPINKQFTIVLGQNPFMNEPNNNKKHRGVYVNPVGIQNTGNEVFAYDGGSFVSDGEVAMRALDNFEPSAKTFDFNNLIPNEIKISHKMYQAILHALRYFDEETLAYKPKWLIGVSGGLDSSVSVAMLVDAFGKDRVLGVNMPSEFTRDITKNNASHLSEKLGFPMLTIPIGDMAKSTVESFNQVGYETIEGLSYENIQARLRGHTLMTLSSLENGVVVNNGNKIEVAFGYATLYGDAIGALAILGDLNKLEVGALADSFNDIHGEEMIPKNLIPTLNETSIDWDFAPSAELAQDQFDPMKWAYHDYLVDYLLNNSVESYMSKYLDGSIVETLPGKYLEAYNLQEPKAFIDDLEWVLRTMNLAVYKRVQAPPIVRVSKRGFGNETQASRIVSKEYQELKNRILNSKK